MRKLRFKAALNEALAEEMRRDERIVLIGEDIGLHGGVFGATQGLMEQFGARRVRQTPISESAIIGTAVGGAMTGLRPVVEIMYIDFTTVAMDQIVNQAAKLPFMSGGKIRLPLTIRTQGGTGTGEAAQHSQSLEAWFVHVPGLKIVMPSTPYDAKGLLKTAIRDDDPVMFIEHKLLYSMTGEVPEEEYTIPFGSADVKRTGHDITVVATSHMVHKALKVAEKMKDEVDIEVVDPRTLVPLDIETIKTSVRKTGKLLVVQEACERGGMGSEILRKVVEEAFDDLESPPKVLGGRNIPMPYSPPLEQASIPQEKDIENAIKELCLKGMMT
jgi:acetoin:2,6-dichlorophenolindophenol oxidoreductase subunit beta